MGNLGSSLRLQFALLIKYILLNTIRGGLKHGQIKIIINNPLKPEALVLGQQSSLEGREETLECTVAIADESKFWPKIYQNLDIVYSLGPDYCR